MFSDESIFGLLSYSQHYVTWKEFGLRYNATFAFNLHELRQQKRGGIHEWNGIMINGLYECKKNMLQMEFFEISHLTTNFDFKYKI